MKIGIISNLYPPFVRGGAEHVVVRTVEALTANGHEVFVISGRPWKEGQDVALNENSTEKVYQFFPKNFYFVMDDSRYRWIVRLFWHIIDAFSSHPASRVRAILEEEKPDVIMTHNLKGLGLRIPGAVRESEAKSIHIVHDLQLIVPSGLRFAGREKEGIAKPFYAIYRWITKRLFANPDIVIFPSNYMKEEYEKYGFFEESEIIVLQNPAPTFPARECRAAMTKKMQLLFVGQLEDHKGIMFLIDALKEMGENIHLHIAGEGTLSPRIKKIAEENKNVTHLGYVAIDQLLSCFEIADALIVPSLCYENSPTVIYESLQAGVPVLAADIGGVGELVQDGKNGFLFNPGDRESLVEAIKKLRTKRTWFAQNCEKVQKTIEPYKLETYIQKIEEIMGRGKS